MLGGTCSVTVGEGKEKAELNTEIQKKFFFVSTNLIKTKFNLDVEI